MNSLIRIYGKVLGLLAAMLLGFLAPEFHRLSFLVQYLLMAMLFLAFLDMDLKLYKFQKSILGVVLANLALGFISYSLLVPVDKMLGLAAFLTAIAPTAIAAPVMISFIQGEVEYVVSAVLITNLTSALVIPLALPFMLDNRVTISVWDILRPVLTVMFIPMLLAWLVRRFPPGIFMAVRRGKSLSFPIWLITLFVISANAADFLRDQGSSALSMLLPMASVSLGICAANFGLGALLGGRLHWQAASQSLGQKNLAFVIWIALNFINPLVAMGPTFYILYHHIYNAWSIYRFEQRRSLALAAQTQPGIDN